MKYVQINAYSSGWADSIVLGLHHDLMNQGHESYVIWGEGNTAGSSQEICIGTAANHYLDAVLTRVDGKMGFHSKKQTRRLLDLLDRINPDIVHLHSLLDYYINVEMLFKWLSKRSCAVRWTLHDCWAFTGFCMHFSYEGCEKWKTGCSLPCPSPPRGRFPDFNIKKTVEWNYEQKRRLFTLLPKERLTIICPSFWLAELVEESFLSKYPIEVIHNEVDRAIFRPVQSDFKKANGINNRLMILGVAGRWSDRKGFDDFCKLARELDDRFAVVVVGLTEGQKSILLGNKGAYIVPIGPTDSREELVKIYSAADVFFNPTKEDNYPTTNLEAQACGTPVFTYDVGGCKETLQDPRSKVVDNLKEAIYCFKSLHSSM